MGFIIKNKGNFNNTENYLNKMLSVSDEKKIREIASDTVNKLKAATPVNSSLTANSWSYTFKERSSGFSIEFDNTNIQNGVNVAIILNYGHATKDGHWIEGKHYIEKPIQDAYNEIINKAWEGLNNL